MTFHIITLFPKSFDSYLGESILKRAIEDKKIKVKFYNPREYAVAKHSLLRGGSSKFSKAIRIDRPPFGGGPGMVIQAEPVIKAVEAALRRIRNSELRIKGKFEYRGREGEFTYTLLGAEWGIDECNFEEQNNEDIYEEINNWVNKHIEFRCIVKYDKKEI